MSGYFVVQRNLFEHVDFAPEPFTEREAWLWLISEAAWQPKRVRVGSSGAIVVLARGELAHSLRFLADKWQWSVKRVRGFLDRSEKQERITRKRAHDGAHDGAIITICNYDKYQLSGHANGHAEGQSEGTPRAREGHKEEELKKEIQIDDGGSAPGDINRESIEVAKEIGRICGYADATEWPWVNPVERTRRWLQAGWRKEIIVESVRAQMAKKRDGPPSVIHFFEKGIARAHADADAPLPIPTAEGQPNATRRKLPDTDDILERLEAFGAS